MTKKIYKDLVVVGMSGGVDSSVTAFILKEQGYKVLGLFMQNWEDEDDASCNIKNDLLDAASVADLIGIDFEYINFSKKYKEKVFSIFLKEYSAGRTPNPDILCNSEIKFRSFLEHSLKIGANKIATGHYARVRNINGTFQLLKAIDLSKDQSYFLYKLNQEQLSHVMFPLGGLLKTHVREIANNIGLHNANKKDSTGICFIGKRSFSKFLSKYIPEKNGSIISIDGEELGTHNGVHFYTIGQRKGLGIGGIKNNCSESEPWYVVGKNIDKNIIYVARGHDNKLLYSKTLEIDDINWISNTPPKHLFSGYYYAKSRYRQSDAECNIKYYDNKTIINFVDPQWAITKGQSLVMYDKDICLGGGIIC